MLAKQILFTFLTVSVPLFTMGQGLDPYKPDNRLPVEIAGMKLLWNDEFNNNGKPDTISWGHEEGFVRNKELQWYQIGNATCRNGVLLIEGRREQIRNPNFDGSSKDWTKNRAYASYTSASINTPGKHQWQFGRLEVRARIDTAHGSWPAIWTLGVNGEWPSNGEIDIMEFYRISDQPTILANAAWGTRQRYTARWDSEKIPLSRFTANDPEWTKKFHVWRMDWDQNNINIYLDDILINSVDLRQTLNPDGTNPFLQPHYLLLNLALGENGGDPSQSSFPIKYEVDYVRVYQYI